VRRPLATLRLVGIVAVVAVTLFPVYYLILTSLKPTGLLFEVPPRFIFRPSFEAFRRVLVEGHHRYFLTSLLVSTVSAFLAVGLASMGAFAFTYYRFPFREGGFFLCILGQMFPPVTTLVPIFLMVQTLRLLDHPLGLILPYVAFQVPLVLLIMRGFFRQVPIELYESASLDGAGTLQLFARIALPLTTPGLLASGVLAFILTWNELLFALVLTSSRARTASVGLASFLEAEGAVQWQLVAALGVLTILPVFLFMGAMHRFMVRGLTMGALKG
jgi:multiple sugar transport system permease protein